MPDGGEPTIGGLTDADFRRTMVASIRLLAVLAVAGAALAWWRGGWASGLLLLIGAAISGASLWEWLRLMTAVMERMDAGATPRPLGRVILGFFLRLGLTVLLLYVSLRYLNGSVFALSAGLGLGVVALSVEALRLMKQWTV